MDDLIATREGLNRADWGALYMQTPTGEDGNVFNKDDFQDWDEDDPPECDEIIQTLEIETHQTPQAESAPITGQAETPVDADNAAEDSTEPPAIDASEQSGNAPSGAGASAA